MNRENLKLKLREIFIKEDPVALYFKEDNNVDEYDSEIELIINEFSAIDNKEQLLDIVYRVFVATVGKQEAGSIERYAKAVNSIWDVIRVNKIN